MSFLRSVLFSNPLIFFRLIINFIHIPIPSFFCIIKLSIDKILKKFFTGAIAIDLPFTLECHPLFM